MDAKNVVDFCIENKMSPLDTIEACCLFTMALIIESEMREGQNPPEHLKQYEEMKRVAAPYAFINALGVALFFKKNNLPPLEAATLAAEAATYTRDMIFEVMKARGES